MGQALEIIYRYEHYGRFLLDETDFYPTATDGILDPTGIIKRFFQSYFRRWHEKQCLHYDIDPPSPVPLNLGIWVIQVRTDPCVRNF